MSDFSGRSWRVKFRDAFRGAALPALREKSFRVHLTVGGAVLALAAWLRVSPPSWAMLALAIGLVLTAEHLNTAVEILSRAVESRPHPLLRDALDVASGAVLIASATAAVIGVLVLGPPLWKWFTH